MDTGVIFNANTYGSKAEEDMVNARAVISGRYGTPRAGIFWCEQAIEKYFKHQIAAARKGDFSSLINQHKLLPLARESGYACSQSDRGLLRELSSMYYERYPQAGDEPAPEDPTWEEASSALELAEKVRTWAVHLAHMRAAKLRESLNKLRLDNG